MPEIVKKEYPRLMLIRPSQLRAVVEDLAFMLPSTATLALSYRRLPGEKTLSFVVNRRLNCKRKCRTPPCDWFRRLGTWFIIL